MSQALSGQALSSRVAKWLSIEWLSGREKELDAYQEVGREDSILIGMLGEE